MTKKKYVTISWYLSPKVRQALTISGFIDSNGKILRTISPFINKVVLDKLMSSAYGLNAKRIRLKVLREIKIDLAVKFNSTHEELKSVNEEISELENE